MIDASPINAIDYTAMQKLHELCKELAAQDIMLGVAGAKKGLDHFFRPAWLEEELNQGIRLFPGIESSIQAFEQRAARKKHADEEGKT